MIKKHILWWSIGIGNKLGIFSGHGIEILEYSYHKDRYDHFGYIPPYLLRLYPALVLLL